jgi:hypothetical protein
MSGADAGVVAAAKLTAVKSRIGSGRVALNGLGTPTTCDVLRGTLLGSISLLTQNSSPNEHRSHNYKVRKNRHSHLHLQRTFGLKKEGPPTGQPNQSDEYGLRLGIGV